MSDDAVLKILIEFGLDDEAAKHAASRIDDLKVNTKRAGERAEEFNIHSREMNRLFHELNHVVPRLGTLLHSAFNPTALGIVGATLLIGQIVEKMKEAAKRAEELAEAQAQLTADTWIAQRDAAQEAANAANEYAAGLAKAGEKADTLKSHNEAALAVLDAQIEAHKKLIEALEQEQMAEAAGDADKEAAVKARFGNLKTDYDLVAEQTKLEQQKQFASQLARKQPHLEDAAAELQRKYEAELGSGSASEAAARLVGKDEKALRAKVERLKNAGQDWKQLGMGDFGELAQKRNIAEYELAEFEKDKAAVEEHERRKKKLQEDRDAAIKARDDNAKAAAQEAQNVRTGVDVFGIHRQSAREMSAVDTYGKGVASMEAQSHGAELSKTQQAQIESLKTLFKSIGWDAKQSLALTQALITHQQSLAGQRDAMLRQIENLERKIGRIGQ
jgi:hypothetical protein